MEIIGWLGFSILVGYFANKKGRNGVGWCFLALFISPLLAGIALSMCSDETAYKKIEDVERKTDNLGLEMNYHQKFNDLRSEFITKQIDSVRQSIQPSMLDGHNSMGRQLTGVIICKSCHKTYSQTANFCPHCGAPNNLFTKCSKCGAMSPKDLLYCGSCGNQLRQIISCSNCGEKSTQQDQVFCAKCGNKLSTNESIFVKPDNKRLSLACPTCNAEFSVDSSFVGKLVECSQCKSEIRIKAPNYSNRANNNRPYNNQASIS